MDFDLSLWPTSSDEEFWRQWAIHSVGELSLLAHWRDDHETWRQRLFETLAGLLDFREPCEPVEEQLLGRRDMTTFSIQKIAFPGAGGVTVTAYVCIPHDNEEPLPAVVCYPPQGQSKEKVVGLLDIHNPETAFGAHLAADGYVVMCIDRRGEGERIQPDYGPQLGDWAGTPTVGRDATDLAIARQILQNRPDVIDERIGVIGFDRTGAAALCAAALDAGFYATALCGCIARCRSLPLAGDEQSRQALSYLYRDTVPPGLLKYADFEDVACLLAPRVLCLYQAGGDIPVEVAEDAAGRVRQGYNLMGEKIKLEMTITPEPDTYPGEPVLQFLEDWLKLPVA